MFAVYRSHKCYKRVATTVPYRMAHDGHKPTAEDSIVKDVVHFEGSDFEAIREGLADILTPLSFGEDPKSSDGPSKQTVFYNPIQQFNRDLSVLAIKAYGEDYLYSRNRAAFAPPRQRQSLRTNESTPLPFAENENSALSHNGDLDSGARQKRRKLHHEAPLRTHGGPHNIPLDHKCGTPVDATVQKPPKLKILDALSASGLRALRYAHEIPSVTAVVANDLSAAATKAMQRNVSFNQLEHKVYTTTGDAISHMHDVARRGSEKASGPHSLPSGKYDVIDLDPYGTAVPFLDSAMQAISNNGLLCVTCTDASVWASCGYPEKTYALYGGTPIRGLHSHEGGLRLIIQAIATAAARHGMAVEPLLSLSIDFYARIFVRVKRSPVDVKLLASKTMLVYSCDSGCGAWVTQQLARSKAFTSADGQPLYKHGLAQAPVCNSHCEHCGSVLHLSGPMYAGPLHNPAYIRTILRSLPHVGLDVYQTLPRIEGMLITALEESLADSPPSTSTTAHEGDEAWTGRPVPEMEAGAVEQFPFFFLPTALAKVLKCQSPPEAAIKGALRHSGYRVSRSHIKPGSVRTNAPWLFIWDMMRAWVQQHAPVKEGSLSLASAGYKILYGRKTGAGANSEQSRTENKAVPDIREDRSQGHIGSIIPSDTLSVQHIEEKNPLSPIEFDLRLGKDAVSRAKIVRYQANPRENWGPIARAASGQTR